MPLSLRRLPVGRERGEPVDGEAPEDGLHALPPRLPHPARLHLLQRLDALKKVLARLKQLPEQEHLNLIKTISLVSLPSEHASPRVDMTW